MARAQSVRTDAGWHGRIVGDNGEPVWTTEVYNDPRHVINALLVLADVVHARDATPEVERLEHLDQRTRPPI